MPRLVLLLLLLSLPFMAWAQHRAWHGSWSATTSNGRTVLGGTWEAATGDDADTLSGTWTLMDHSGATLADGTWAARKDRNVWKGIWKARTRSNRIYSGTWRVQSQLPTSSRFADLFESALRKMASGTWRAGAAYSGSWSLRAFPR